MIDPGQHAPGATVRYMTDDGQLARGTISLVRRSYSVAREGESGIVDLVEEREAMDPTISELKALRDALVLLETHGYTETAGAVKEVLVSEFTTAVDTLAKPNPHLQ